MADSYIPTADDATEAMGTVKRSQQTGGLIGLLAGGGLGWLGYNFITTAATEALTTGVASQALGGLLTFQCTAAGATGIGAAEVVIAGLSMSPAIAAIGIAALIGVAAWGLGNFIGKTAGVSKARHQLEERAAQSESQEPSRAPELSQGKGVSQSQEQSSSLASQEAPKRTTLPNEDMQTSQSGPDQQTSFLARELEKANQKQLSMAQGNLR